MKQGNEAGKAYLEERGKRGSLKGEIKRKKVTWEPLRLGSPQFIAESMTFQKKKLERYC